MKVEFYAKMRELINATGNYLSNLKVGDTIQHRQFGDTASISIIAKINKNRKGQVSSVICGKEKIMSIEIVPFTYLTIGEIRDINRCKELYVMPKFAQPNFERGIKNVMLEKIN